MPWTRPLTLSLAPPLARGTEWLLALLLAGGLAAATPGAAGLLPGAVSTPVAGLCTATSLAYAPDVNGYATMGNVSSGAPFAANTAFNSVSTVYFWHSAVSTPWRSFTSSGSTTNCNNYYKYESWRGTAASSAGNTIVAKWGLMANIRYANTSGTGIQPLASGYAWHSTTLNVVPTTYSNKWSHTLVEGVYAAAGQRVLWAPCTSVYSSAAALSRAETGAAPGANCEAVASDTTLAGAATFTYDATAPSLTASVPASSAASPVFTLTDGNYNGLAGLNVGTVTASDFTITNGTFASAACAAGACTVTVTPTGQGTVTLAPSGTMSISDLATNAQTSAWTAASTVYDTVAPSVTSFTANTPGPTRQSTVVFSLVFSEAVTGLTAADLTIGGTTTGWSILTITGSGTSYSVSVTRGGTGSDGTITLTLATGSVDDAVGNQGPAAGSTSTTSIIHTSGPTVLSFTTAVASPTNSTTIDYALTFDEPVTGLAPDDLSNTGTATGCVFAVAGSGASYTLTVTGCSASGTLAPQLAANTVADTAANAGPGTAVTGPALTLDRVAPTVGSFTTAVVSPTNSTSIAYALAFSESVTGLAPGDFSNAGTATGCTFTPSGSGTSYTLTVTTCSASGTLVPRLATSSMGDIAGNTGPASATDGPSLTLDRVTPAVTTFTTSEPSPTIASTISYALTFDESVAGLVAGDFANVGTATGCAFAVAGSGASYTITVTGCSLEATLTPQLAAGSVVDSVGNAGPAGASSGSTLYLGTGSPTGFTITAGDFDFGSAGPGGGLGASTSLSVSGSNPTGYEVALVLSDLLTASPRVTGERIGAGGIALASCPTVLAAGAATALCPTGGLNVVRTLVHATSATLLGGDLFTIALALSVPWVADGAYSGTATFQVTAL